MTRKELAARVSSLYEQRFLQHYVRWKVRLDPAYAAVLETLRGHSRPVIDLGCGIGALAFFLREGGCDMPIVGVDFDARKIDVALRAAQRYRGLDFVTGDARHELPAGYNVVMLDILQYFDRASQEQILGNVVTAAPPDGIVIIRQAIHEKTWRQRVTSFVDAIGRAVRWTRGETLTFPARETITGAFSGFASEIRPLRGMGLYNNYLFVFRRAPSSGMTNA
ncbi:MAG TPA: class I SAM-dependent methyltransferase [Thermoanaerobaculia bacterium]|nr:class I SAM-dependent methyltransferase [Thermoanaerobaculia bacterium]